MKKVLALMVAAAFVLTMYVPASAADFDMYGIAKINTFWTDSDEDRENDDRFTEIEGGLADETQLNHDLNGTSRLGGSVEEGPIAGHFEFGINSDDEDNFTTRILKGTVDMGQGELLIGQDYTPYGAQAGSGQVYNGDNGMNEFTGYTGRLPMVQYAVDGFKIALVNPQADETDYQEDLFDGTLHDDFEIKDWDATDAVVNLPMLQASYDLDVDGMDMNFAGAYQTYELKNDDVAELDGEDVDAWGLSANFEFNQMDPAYIILDGFYGQNVANMGQYGADAFTVSSFQIDGNDTSLEDTDTWAGLLAVGTQIDTIGMEAGIGYRESDNDLWDNEMEVIATYGNVTIPLTADGNAIIVPEIGYYDYGDDPMNNNGSQDDFGDELYAGVKWQVSF